MKDEFKYKVKKFHEAMKKLGDDVYSSKMINIKLKTNIFLVADNHLLITVNSD